MSARDLVDRDALKSTLECFNPSANTLYDFLSTYEQFKRNKLDTGEVDEEAVDKALQWAFYKAEVTSDEVRGIIQVYEAAKLNKEAHYAENSKMMPDKPKVDTIGIAWERFKKENDTRLREIEKAVGLYA